MNESSAVIKLTQSEITHTIMALVMARQASANLGICRGQAKGLPPGARTMGMDQGTISWP